MTTFQEPFTVKTPNSDDPLFTVSASGVVSKNPIAFTGGIAGDADITGSVTVSGSASVTGPILNGAHFVPFIINVPVSGAALVVTAGTLPGANHAVIDGKLLVEVSASGMTGGIDFRIGDVANSDRFGTVIGVSAAGEYAFVLGSAAASAGTKIIVDATVQGSAGNVATFSSRLFLTVVPTS